MEKSKNNVKDDEQKNEENQSLLIYFLSFSQLELNAVGLMVAFFHDECDDDGDDRDERRGSK